MELKKFDCYSQYMSDEAMQGAGKEHVIKQQENSS